ncbi:MAG: L-rhamnose/proton symporter RhaT [Acidobacteriaceae bacterium]
MNIPGGIAAAIVAGCMNGLFPLPMKAIKSWAWENIWLPFSVLSFVIFPWVIVWLTVPHPSVALLHADNIDLVAAFCCGILAYTGSLLFGISLVYIGVALSFALLIGTMTVVGVLAPPLLLGRSLLKSPGGTLILGGVALAVVSVALGFIASRGKVQDRNGATQPSASNARGSLLAIFGGALSGLLPAGMAMPWAHRLVDSAVRFGSASPSQAVNVALAVMLAGGALPNCGYSIYLLCRNRTYRGYRRPIRFRYWLLVLSMGALYSASVGLWGVAISPPLLGVLGPSVGWALFVGMIVLSSTATGLLAGEWKFAKSSSIAKLGGSVLALICAMVLICLGTYFGLG